MPSPGPIDSALESPPQRRSGAWRMNSGTCVIDGIMARRLNNESPADGVAGPKDRGGMRFSPWLPPSGVLSGRLKYAPGPRLLRGCTIGVAGVALGGSSFPAAYRDEERKIHGRTKPTRTARRLGYRALARL